MIGYEQSTFILGRRILDGPLMLSEIMSWYRRKKQKPMILKVDFEKAFDIVSWKYLDHMISSLGFGCKWRRWIHMCLHSARASILVNGSPISEFSIKRGPRQGDPMIPFLFIIFMKGLHFALKDAGYSGLLRGLLSRFRAQINILKFHVYGLGVSTVNSENMARDTGCSSGNIPFSYLGLPIGLNMNLLVNWNHLMDRFRAKLSSWKENLLYRAIHGDEAGFDLKGCNSSGIWSFIISSYSTLHARDIILSSSLCRKVGDDHFSNDTWIWNWTRQSIGSQNVAALDAMISEIGLSNHFNLSLRGIEISSIACPSCNVDMESNDHIFFECNTDSNIWCLVRTWTDSNMPSFSSRSDWLQWFENLRASKVSKDYMYAISVATLWVL
nr:RNA-directed DNA polymerase, eukaryota, reverse transcriptase zinc-binding domain protein [Tanacetum cinerariifolium]